MKYPENYDEKFAPLSPWAYWGLQLLFSVPVVGLVFLIIFTFSGKNINRRNFARSYWITAILALIIFGVLIACGVSLAALESVVPELSI